MFVPRHHSGFFHLWVHNVQLAGTSIPFHWENDVVIPLVSKLATLQSKSWCGVWRHEATEDTTEHLHIVWRDYRDSSVRATIHDIFRNLGLRRGGGEVLCQICLRKYLSQGNGRSVLCEKNPPTGYCRDANHGFNCKEELGRDLQVEALDDGKSPVRPEQPNLSPNQATSDGSGASSCKRVSQQPMGGNGAKKKAMGREDKWEKIRKLVEEFQPPTLSEFRMCMANTTLSPSIRTWYAQNFQTKDFDQYVQGFIQYDKLKIRNMEWRDRLLKRNCKSFELCNRALMNPVESKFVIEELLRWNGIDKDSFVVNLHSVINKTAGKKNSILFIGPSNCGKTLLATSIAQSCIYYDTVQKLDRNSSTFVWMNATTSSLILIEEPRIDPGQMEKCLNIFAGQAVQTDVKYQAPQSLLQTPCLITSNKSLETEMASKDMAITRSALNNRMTTYQFKYAPWLAKYNGKIIDPNAWLTFLDGVPYDTADEAAVYPRGASFDPISCSVIADNKTWDTCGNIVWAEWESIKACPRHKCNAVSTVSLEGCRSPWNMPCTLGQGVCEKHEAAYSHYGVESCIGQGQYQECNCKCECKIECDDVGGPCNVADRWHYDRYADLYRTYAGMYDDAMFRRQCLSFAEHMRSPFLAGPVSPISSIDSD